MILTMYSHVVFKIAMLCMSYVYLTTEGSFTSRMYYLLDHSLLFIVNVNALSNSYICENRLSQTTMYLRLCVDRAKY